TVEDSGQIDAGFADEPTPELDCEARRRERRGRSAKRVVERDGDAVNVQRLVPRPAGNVEPAAKIELGDRRTDQLGNLPGVHDRDAMDLRETFGVKTLRAGEHVETPPVDAGFHQTLYDRRNALGIDAEGTGDATQGHPPGLDGEGRRHSNRDFGLDPDLLRRPDRADGLALALDADGGPRLDRFRQLDVELAGPGEI